MDDRTDPCERKILGLTVKQVELDAEHRALKDRFDYHLTDMETKMNGLSERTDTLEGIVIGVKGQPGLGEHVRGLSARWAAMIVIVTFVATTLTNLGFMLLTR